MSLPPEKSSLSAADLLYASIAIDCEQAAIRAVAKVEGLLRGFFDGGPCDRLPVVLFERHLFHRLTGGKFDGSLCPGLPPDCSLISAAAAGGYGPYSVQHRRLAAAKTLDRNAAVMATSFGMFQVLGENAKKCGLSLSDFEAKVYTSLRGQLEVFVSLVKSDKYLRYALGQKDWELFALHYNGPDFKKTGYDTKIMAAYEELRDR